MNLQEIIARTKAASANISMEDLEGVEIVEVEEDSRSFDDYWGGSASQSYCESVKKGNVRTIAIN